MTDSIIHTSRASLLTSTTPDTLVPIPSVIDLVPQRCLTVEDAPDGITAVQRAGIRVLLVRGGQLSWPADSGLPTHDVRATRT